jgi:hypothetical protein
MAAALWRWCAVLYSGAPELLGILPPRWIWRIRVATKGKLDRDFESYERLYDRLKQRAKTPNAAGGLAKSARILLKQIRASLFVASGKRVENL